MHAHIARSASLRARLHALWICLLLGALLWSITARAEEAEPPRASIERQR